MAVPLQNGSVHRRYYYAKERGEMICEDCGYMRVH